MVILLSNRCVVGANALSDQMAHQFPYRAFGQVFFLGTISTSSNSYIVKFPDSTYQFDFINIGQSTWRVAVTLKIQQKVSKLTNPWSLNKCISFNSNPSDSKKNVHCGRFFLIKRWRHQGHGKRICAALCALFFSHDTKMISVMPTSSALAKHFWGNVMGFKQEAHSALYTKTLMDA